MNVQDDIITMKDGKVVIITNEGMKPIEEAMTTSDGTRVMPNGQLLLADGTARMLREGENLTMGRTSKDASEMTDRSFREAMEDEELRDDIK